MTEPDEPSRQTLVTGSDPEAAHASVESGVVVDRRHQVMVIVSMYVGYATFMVLRMAPTVAGASITSDPNLTVSTGDWGRILAMGTIGAVVGKFIGGYAADRIGGRLTFSIGLCVSAIGVLLFAVSSAVWMFQAAFFLALMAKSSGWPSMAKIIVTSFRANEYGRVWGVLATSSRVGTLIATFCLGALLGFVSWQTTLVIAGIAGILTTGYFFQSLKSAEVKRVDLVQDEVPAQPTSSEQPQSNEQQQSKPVSEHPLHGTNVGQAVGYFFGSAQFWLITGSLMGLTIMWDFLLMVPLYLRDTLDMTPSSAAMASSAFPFGSLISVLVGGFVFDKLNRRSTAWLMGALLAVAASCILSFHLMSLVDLSSNAEVGLSLALLFTFGLCVSPCYYIPMSVFSINFGGPHSGFLIALLDALAFGATAAFYYFAGDLAEASWSLFLFVLLAVAVWSMLTTLFFMLGEARRLVAPEHA